MSIWDIEFAFNREREPPAGEREKRVLPITLLTIATGKFFSEYHNFCKKNSVAKRLEDRRWFVNGVTDKDAKLSHQVRSMLKDHELEWLDCIVSTIVYPFLVFLLIKYENRSSYLCALLLKTKDRQTVDPAQSSLKHAQKKSRLKNMTMKRRSTRTCARNHVHELGGGRASRLWQRAKCRTEHSNATAAGSNRF